VIEIVGDTPKRLSLETEIIEQIRAADTNVLLNCTPDGKKTKTLSK